MECSEPSRAAKESPTSNPTNSGAKETDLESLVQQFVIVQQQTNAKNDQAIQRLEAQMGQMARELSERKKGEFPAQTIPNPEGYQQLKAIIVLINGKVIGIEVTTQTPPVEASTSKVNDKEEMNAQPFPQRLVKPNKEKKLLDIFEILRKLRLIFL